MGNIFTTLAVLVGVYFIGREATGRILMGLAEQKAALDATIGDLKTSVNGAAERIETKLDEMQAALDAAGEPDVNLQDSIDAIRGETARLSTIAAAPSSPGETGEAVEGEASPGGFVEDTETGETSEESSSETASDTEE